MSEKVNTQMLFETYNLVLNDHKVKRIAEDNFTKYFRLTYTFNYNSAVDSSKIRTKLGLIYWAVASVQTELSNCLLHWESHDTPDLGDNAKQLSRMMFFHHYFLSIECIYRVWERFTHILYLMHNSKEGKNGYYHTILKKIESHSSNYPQALVGSLKKHNDEWGKVKTKRNEFSHEYSNLIEGTSFEVTPLKILGPNYEQLFEVEEKTEALENYYNSAMQHYNYLEEIDKTLQSILVESS